MITIYPYKLLIDLHQHSSEFTFPIYLKNLIKNNDIGDFEKLGDFFDSELQQIPLQDQQTLRYFLFISELALQSHIYRRDSQRFDQTNSLIQHRMTAIRNIEGTQINFSEWEKYIEFISTVFKRTSRFIPIEEFESYLDKIEWNELSEELIPKISNLLGLTYLMEDHPEQVNKSRVWLFKASNESSFPANMVNQLLWVEFYKKINGPEVEDKVAEIAVLLKEKGDEYTGALGTLFHCAAVEVETSKLNMELTNPGEEEDSSVKAIQELGEWKLELQRHFEENLSPGFSKAYVDLLMGKNYALALKLEKADMPEETFQTLLHVHLQQALDQIEELGDSYSASQYKLESMEAKILAGQQLPEKEFKELLTLFRKNNDYPSFCSCLKVYGAMLSQNEMGIKIQDLLLEGFKLGKKKIEEGGFYVLNQSFRLANNLYLSEIKRPGVSWLISSIDKFFGEITGIIDDLPSQVQMVGSENIEDFRSSYLAFEPISHYNILVYFRYQLYTLKLMNLGASFGGDKTSQLLGDQLIKELENPNNPLNFINASWDDFKDIPNKVRNSTLNKCINITKGDLPLAAEHLDFSYRNLRSYITFKEVNRLGLFLNLQETDNKQLEMGIRYMFYDLYKKGTIFEVVFDMPIFLVKYSQKGFYSQNLEEELRIKGTTAKKYIKIMMEIGLIRQDKNSGRKHFYQLNKENVMKRLGREQEIRIG